MSSISTPSKPFHFFDVPEAQNLNLDFEYNFFVSDETVDESGNDAVRGNLSQRFLDKGTANLGNLNSRIPRYIKLQWSVKDTPKPTMGNKSRIDRGINQAKMKELLSKGKIYTETLASGKDHDSYFFGNNDLPDMLNNMWISRFTALGLDEASREEMLSVIAEGSSIDNDELEAMLPPLNQRGGILRNYLKAEKTSWGAGALNTSYAPFAIRPHVDRANDPYFNATVTKFMDALSQLEPDDRCHVTNAEYVFDVPWDNIQRTSDASFIGEAVVVGYVFEKWREWQGKKYKMPAVVVVGENNRNAYDSEVAYGQTYLYSCRTVARVRVPFTDFDTGQTYIGTFFLASRPTSVVRKTCLEERIPSWPPDVNFYYDFANNSLRLTWAPPVNSQQDIKYIQIFRRKSIEEPFTLMKHFDFDDSVIRMESKEHIETTLIENRLSIEMNGNGQGYPTTWIDSEFGRESSYIYAIVAIDARQNSSAYSAQIQVTFDQTKNKIHKKLVSYGGAPKAYPNWYLKENFFSDCIKDSMHHNVRIYFDPECYTICRTVDGQITRTKHVVTTKPGISPPEAKYVFQFINTDRLLESKLDVMIDDSRIKRQNQSIRRSENILSTGIDFSGDLL